MIPNDIKKHIEEKYSGTSGGGLSALGAIYGYSLAEKEIERLKGLIEEFTDLRKFFKKGSPLTEMMDKIISKSNAISNQ